MKLLIAGSRRWKDFQAIREQLDFYVTMVCSPDEIVSGGCSTGADRFGEKWAAEVGLPVKRFLADWHVHGKAAGPIRNAEMAAYCDKAVVFWDGKSKGTKNMIDELKKANKPCYIVKPS